MGLVDMKPHPSELGHFLPEARQAIARCFEQSARFSARVVRIEEGAGDASKRVWDFDFPLTHEGMSFATRWPGVDGSISEAALDLTFRTPRQTFADTIRWLYESGHIDATKAGRLAGTVLPS